jgi:hypothetical protein
MYIVLSKHLYYNVSITSISVYYLSERTSCYILNKVYCYFETLDDDQSVYKRIVDRLEDLQRFHQLLPTCTAENGIHYDPKTFESK